MEQLLSTVASSEMFLVLDGFLGYNQVLFKPKDQHKTTFTTKWGMFAYQKMSFRLSNVGVTFLRAMDLDFKEINKIILIYLDDLTMFLKHKEDQYDHLELVFQKCVEFGISLNPKKCIFGVL